MGFVVRQGFVAGRPIAESPKDIAPHLNPSAVALALIICIQGRIASAQLWKPQAVKT